jgi:transcriptional regulator with XRE-family HTH domain
VNIGSRVRAKRRALNLSQEALARRAGVTLNAVGALERGVSSDPHYSTLAGLAAALDTSISDLLGEEPELANPKAKASSPSELTFNDVLQEQERREEEAAGDLFLLGGALGAERPPLEGFSEDLLDRTLARFIAVRRRLRDSESEELKRGGGDLTDRLIIAVAEELDERLFGGLGEEELVERLSERDYEALAELYRLSEPRKESMPRMHAVAERSLARSGARVGVRGEWEEEPFSAMQRERNAAPRTPDEVSGAEAG